MRVCDHRVGGGGTMLPEERRHHAQRPTPYHDVIRRVALLAQRDADRHHVTSGRRACALTARARTNSRSESRFRYCPIAGLIVCWRASVPTARSARRPTVRARWNAAALGAPPGRTEVWRG